MLSNEGLKEHSTLVLIAANISLEVCSAVWGQLVGISDQIEVQTIYKISRFLK